MTKILRLDDEAVLIRRDHKRSTVKLRILIREDLDPDECMKCVLGKNGYITKQCFIEGLDKKYAGFYLCEYVEHSRKSYKHSVYFEFEDRKN